MANSTAIRVSTFFFFFFILFVHVMGSRATSYRGQEMMRKRIDSRHILLELGFDLSNMMDGNGRKMVDTDRVAPGGPDPQHH
ncbi:CLAVATA3/ESR (CLE)-related protein 5 [Camellia lanceoleosa]|uniref:CLAVATA3/ESR (CLE)-related protein 5 n=1 Tax=Camellia lanceoleosa TaxID=1840588 RepID=A0ACC0GDK3_9ERIC|nr:CLAVATA3/ESR (CLE)-related protein 5 [Camellia lanceoleosa]